MARKPLQIIHIVYNSSPSLKTSNGVAFVLYNTVEEQIKQNIEVSVLELGKKQHIDNKSSLGDCVSDIAWYRIKKIKEYLLSVKKEDLLCVFHSVHVFPFIVIGYLLRYLNIPYIVICHGGLLFHELKKK